MKLLAEHILLVIILTFATTTVFAKGIKLKAGEPCYTCKFESCTCKTRSDCVLLRDRDSSNTTYCYRKKGVVCCPDEPQDLPTFMPISRAEKACSEFKTHAPAQCSRYFISGGELAKAREFPPAALIGVLSSSKNNPYYFFCGGTLISERFVLSAAHCTNIGLPNVVRLGDLDYSTTRDDEGLQEFSISRTIIHPQFSIQLYFDIMLIELNGTVSFTEYVLPACVLTPDMMKYHSGMYWAVGWGYVNGSDVDNSQLRRVQLELDGDECKKFASRWYDPLIRGLARNTQFCAKGGIRDTCKGDSGGPLLVPFPYNQEKYACMYMVAGIVSMGQVPCGIQNMSSINTNVTSFYRFIEERVWPQLI